MKFQVALDGFIVPVPEKAIATEHVPFALGRTVTRGPRESSLVYSETVQSAGVLEVNVIPSNSVNERPSVDVTEASRNAPESGIEVGAMRLTHDACRKNWSFCVTARQ